MTYNPKKNTSPIILTLVLSFVLVSLPQISVAKAEGTIYIRADGSVEGTDKILKDENVYKLIGDITVNASTLYGIKVETDNVIIDGAGYTIQGAGAGRGIEIANPYNTPIKTSYNVKIMNVTIQGFENGIAVFGYWGNIIEGVIIAGNNLTKNDTGIRFSSYSNFINNSIIGNHVSANRIGIDTEMGHIGEEGNNQIVGNQIVGNEIGMYFIWMGDFYSWKPNPFYMNNSIYNNNFIGNNQNVVNGHIIYTPDCANTWDNNEVGNYWSDYNGTDADGDGLGDTPYSIDENNQDNYPLMNPVDISTIPEFSSWIVLPITMTMTLVVAVLRRKVIWRKEL